MPTAKEAKAERDAQAAADGHDVGPQDALAMRDESGIDPAAKAIMDRIESQMDEADSLDELLAGGTTTPAEEIAGIPFIIRGFAVRESAEFDGPFAVLHVVERDTGEERTVSCGGQLVLAVLRNAVRLGHAQPNDYDEFEWIGEDKPMELNRRGRAWKLELPHDRRVVQA